jgi:hypothetical protein
MASHRRWSRAADSVAGKVRRHCGSVRMVRRVGPATADVRTMVGPHRTMRDGGSDRSFH